MITELPKTDMGVTTDGCCPLFDPAPWDGKEFSFEGLEFVEATTRSFFYMPLDMAKVMAATGKAISDAGAAPADRYLVLSSDASPWKATHRFLVTKPVPGLPKARVEGVWLAKTFDGSFNRMGSWYRELSESATRNGVPPSEMLAFYTTCPSCAKKTGHNYVVLFARLHA